MKHDLARAITWVLGLAFCAAAWTLIIWSLTR